MLFRSPLLKPQLLAMIALARRDNDDYSLFFQICQLRVFDGDDPAKSCRTEALQFAAL
jgi:hypothetical protein